MTDRTHPDSGRTTGGIVEMLQDRIAELEQEAAHTDSLLGKANALARIRAHRIAELEAQLEAICAGGVSGPLMGKPQAMPDLSALTERGAKAWAGVDAQGLREGFTAADMATAAAQGFMDGAASTAPPTAQAEGWISMAERLPAANVTVLLTIDGKHITTGEYIRSLSCFSWNTHDHETDDSRVTHWMPLPPPPTTSAGSGKGE